MKQFKDHLVELIKERGETISSVSKATGIPASTLSEWCNGRKPTLDGGIIQLTRYLGVTIERLLSGVDPGANVLEDILKNGLENGVEVHTGIYRIRIERITEAKNKKTNS